MSRGHVYILTNPSMPGLVKIGRTCRDVDGRAMELYQTGVPTPFCVFYYVEAPDCEGLEALMHAELQDGRVSDAREFFRISADKAAERLDANLYDQVSTWAMGFLPHFRVVPKEMVAHVSHLMDIGEALERRPEDMCGALKMINRGEMEAILSRFDEDQANPKNSGDSSEPQSDEVGDPAEGIEACNENSPVATSGLPQFEERAMQPTAGDAGGDV